MTTLILTPRWSRSNLAVVFKLRPPSFRSAFIVVGVLISALSIASIGLMQYYAARSQDRAEALRALIREVNDVKDVQLELLRQRRETYLFAITQNAEHLTEAEVSRRRLHNNLSQMKVLASNDRMHLVEQVEVTLENYFTRLRSDAPLDRRALTRRYIDGSREFDEAIGAIELFNQASLRESADLEHRISANERFTGRVSIALSALFVLVLLATIFFTERFLLEPLVSLDREIRAFRRGEIPSLVLKGFAEVNTILRAFREMASRLHEQTERQTRFLAAVAHDLRNPVASLQTASECLLEEPDMKAGERAQILQIIARQSQHLARLIGDLRPAREVGCGGFELRLGIHDLNPVLKDAVALYRHSSNCHALTLAIPEHPLLCRCDVDRIQQVVHNLISNAVKYSPEGGTITIEAHETHAGICVDVKDEGIGIPAPERAKIFKPFERGSSLRDKVDGTGLGLATSLEIIKAHAGKLFLLDTDVGRGSTFEMLLPSWKAVAP